MIPTNESRPPLERVSTGHPPADEILTGGFPGRSINLIMGAPGTGKTIFAEQILFHNARGNRPVAFLTTLSEPLPKVLWYLQQFDFYDESLMLESVIYDNLGPDLMQGGVEVVVRRVKELIKQHRPSIIVIDSFKAIHDMAESPSEMRRLTADLVTLLGAYDTTAFLVGEYGPDQINEYPEFAAADGVVELSRMSGSVRDQRSLRVLKLRGSRYREGAHSFSISSAGLSVLPRVVTPRVPAVYEAPDERIASGIGGLDERLGGGLWAGSSTLLIGPAGSGKTTFGLGFTAAGVRAGQPSLFFNFQENPTQLARTISTLGLDVDRMRADGLHLSYASPVELDLDAVMLRLATSIEGNGIQRVVIDALGDLSRVSSGIDRFHDFLYTLVQYLAGHGVTSVFTVQGRARNGFLEHDLGSRFSYISDVILALDTEEEEDPPRRVFQILKGRGIDHSLEKTGYRIHAGGLSLTDEDGV